MNENEIQKYGEIMSKEGDFGRGNKHFNYIPF